MRTQISKYIFDKTAKTVTFTDFAAIELERVLLITNSTRNQIIFNFANPLFGGTVVNNILSLTCDTSQMDNSDKLLIYYENSRNNASEEVLDALFELIKRLDFLPAVRGIAADIRVTPLSTPNMSTLTTVSTVSNQTSIGGYNAASLVPNWQNTLAVQSNINNVIV